MKEHALKNKVSTHAKSMETAKKLVPTRRKTRVAAKKMGVMKHSKEDLMEAHKHMKKHGG